MRVTETRLIEVASKSTTDSFERIAKTQEQLSSGVRVERASDGVADWVNGHRAKVRERYLDANESAIGHSRDRLIRADQVFGGVNLLLERGRELALQARNDSTSPEDRASMATEIQSLRAEALRLVNEQAPDGEFLLAGTDGTRAPFDANGNYLGDDELRSISSDLGIRYVIGTAGTQLTAAAGVDLFETMDRFIAGLETNDVAALDTALDELTAVGDQVANARTQIGARIRPLELAEESLEDLKVVVAERLSDAVGTDPIEAASQFSQELASLQAARDVASRIFSLLKV